MSEAIPFTNQFEPAPPVTGAVGTPSMTPADVGFAVHLDFFSGPMDLLLHLVQQREVSIEKVNIAEVCDQYLEIVTSAQFLDLERAGEYLVIAATLIAMKSQSLLPVAALDPEKHDLDFDPNFYESLRERLLAYEKTKRQAQALTELPQFGRDTFGRTVRLAPVEVDEVEQAPEEAHTLGKMFLALLKRAGLNKQTYKIAFEPISVLTYMMKWVDSLKGALNRENLNGENAAPRRFHDVLKMFRTAKAEGSTRAVVVGGFVSLLELMKRGLVSAEQAEDSEDIAVTMNFRSLSDDEIAGRMTTEFDDEFKSAPELNQAAGVIPFPEDASRGLADEGDSEEVNREAASGR